MGDFFSVDAMLLSGDRRFCRLRVVFGSRNGFRDTGLGEGSSKGEAGLWRLGDTARLRNGLLDDRLSSNPADAWSAVPEQTGQPKDKTAACMQNDDCEKVDETAISFT